ncbi:hypothetical protein BP00DRAFT_264214 [Aspergillus indologenus CBS 114.80]|uniref:Uncharacterized protein n=1 Tax=Aspergillus indologenus CBS 114.80 TaxID=1450541 RepID=A0A2V5HZU2_9EURO|nr:hypothetical protein BP00DRAFT_264214 [Aspergillus indologenus CBS 114.80]
MTLFLTLELLLVLSFPISIPSLAMFYSNNTTPRLQRFSFLSWLIPPKSHLFFFFSVSDPKNH